MATSEMFTPEEIEIIQTRQLRKQLHYCYDRSPFYRDLMDREGLTPADIKSLTDLTHLPVTRKADLLREGDRFLCVRPEEVVDLVWYFGEGGKRGCLKLTEPDLNRLGYNAQIALHMAGMTHQDVAALGLSLDRGELDGLAVCLGLRRIGAAAMRLGPVAAAGFLEQAERQHATTIIAAPGYVRRLAAWAETCGTSMRRASVSRLFCVGEGVRAPDGQLNAFGQLLARLWGAQIVTCHLQTETQTFGCECEAQEGFHLHPELMQVEIVDERGYHVPEGEVGEICLTAFGTTGMPLLRYCTGEWARLHTGPCACGRSTPRYVRLEGRRQPALRWQNRELYPAQVLDPVRAELEVGGFLLLAEDPADGSDRLTLLIDTSNPQVPIRLKDRLTLLLGSAPEIRTVTPDALSQAQGVNELSPPLEFIDRRQHG